MGVVNASSPVGCGKSASIPRLYQAKREAREEIPERDSPKEIAQSGRGSLLVVRSKGRALTTTGLVPSRGGWAMIDGNYLQGFNAAREAARSRPRRDRCCLHACV